MRRLGWTSCAFVAALALAVSTADAQVRRGGKTPPGGVGRAGALEGRRPPGLPPNLPLASFVSARSLISRRTAEARVEQPGPIKLTVQCEEGEIVLGGGHAVDRPPPATHRAVMVEASYPSATDTWTVVFHNFDSLPGGPNVGSMVYAAAHCYRPPGAPPSLRIVASEPVEPPLYAVNTPPTVVVASCPAGNVAISGGFRMQHVPDDPLGGRRGHNLGLHASEPTGVDSSGLPTGWAVALAVWPAPTPTTTAYALCLGLGSSRQALLLCRPTFGRGRTAGHDCRPGPTVRAVSGNAVPVVVEGYTEHYTYYEGLVACDPEEVPIGGGFDFAGDILVVHLLYRNMSAHADDSWDVGGTFGFQPGGSGTIEGWALCARPPEVPLIVRITRPEDRSAVEGAAPDDVASGNVQLSAIGVDASGHHRDDVSFEWWVDGQPVATGADTATSVEVPQCRIREHQIEVRGTDPQGNTATDDVTVFAGGVC